MLGCSPALLGSALCCVQLYNVFVVSCRISSTALDLVALQSVWGAPIHQYPCKIRWHVHIRLDRLPWHAVWCGYRPLRGTIANGKHQIPGMMLRQFFSSNPPAVITLWVGWVFRASIISWVLRKYVRIVLFSGKSMNLFQCACSGMSLPSIMRRMNAFSHLLLTAYQTWWTPCGTDQILHRPLDNPGWNGWRQMNVSTKSSKYFAPDGFPIASTKAWPSMMEHVFNADAERTSAVTPCYRILPNTALYVGCKLKPVHA